MDNEAFIRMALEKLNVPWQQDSVRIWRFVEGKDTAMLPLLVDMCVMNFLTSETNFEGAKEAVYMEFKRRKAQPKRGVVSVYARQVTLRENRDKYDEYMRLREDTFNELCDMWEKQSPVNA